ncbi:MAG TPA: molybdenum cofactor guanylyltransferase [Puia sp.]|jgi:molybdopterin-guanine dinucleotide biosynthesis protein A|nr:molybdenum cofactor guanylyltransferase [Puia sp.]
MKANADAPGRSKDGRIADLLGVILCGGESRRMGRDKGLLLADGVPWALHMAGKLGPWGLPVVYSINKGQYETYSAHLPGQRLVVDRLGLAGPLEGLLTVHAAYPGSDLLLLACDLQDLDAETLSGLIGKYLAEEANAYAYRDADGLQPLCAIYTSVLLRPRYEAVKEGRAIDVRLRSLLDGEGVRLLEAGSEGAFRNYNTL